ncbi:hypothetical protein evm_011503 [Chilo suppressalis]|nr:hypothetical protein evm_011503 [Chilo suppressalis]
MLFLDDSKMKNFTSCFKEKKFLEFFFKRIRINKTGRYENEFPFISLCGRERNFIRCDDVPIVYTHLITVEDDFLTYGYAGDLLKAKFKPNKIFMLPSTGRVYHPAEEKFGGVGLIRSKLAIELSKRFEFHHGESKPPTHFNWKEIDYEIDQDWLNNIIMKNNIELK